MVMDPNTVRQLAEIRQRLSQLESALGARNPADAEAIVRRLTGAVRDLQHGIAAGQDQVTQLQAQLSTAQDAIVQLRQRGNQLTSTVQAQQAQIDTLTTTVQALVTWAQTVAPPFIPQGGP